MRNLHAVDRRLQIARYPGVFTWAVSVDDPPAAGKSRGLAGGSIYGGSANLLSWQ